MIVRSQRASLRRHSPSPRPGLVVDLWSVDQTWRDGVDEARKAEGPVVLLSSIGLTTPRERTRYEEVLAGREDVARRTLPGAVTLRLAPVFDDLEVYDQALLDGQSVHHAYGPAKIRWLTAQDVLEAASAASAAPAGQAFDLAGPTPGSAEDVLTERALRLGVPCPPIVDVPASVLVEQLAAVFGPERAAAFVGHQDWAGRTAAETDDGATTLTAALGREPTSWSTHINPMK